MIPRSDGPVFMHTCNNSLLSHLLFWVIKIDHCLDDSTFVISENELNFVTSRRIHFEKK